MQLQNFVCKKCNCANEGGCQTCFAKELNFYRYSKMSEEEFYALEAAEAAEALEEAKKLSAFKALSATPIDPKFFAATLQTKYYLGVANEIATNELNNLANYCRDFIIGGVDPEFIWAQAVETVYKNKRLKFMLKYIKYLID